VTCTHKEHSEERGGKGNQWMHATHSLASQTLTEDETDVTLRSYAATLHVASWSEYFLCFFAGYED